MANANVYSRALMDHVSSPDYKYKMDEPTLSHEGINPSCGDDLVLDVRLGEDGTISEVSWTGHGCAVSQGSADMMSGRDARERPQALPPVWPDDPRRAEGPRHPRGA